MNMERRNDLGSKISWSILIGLISLMLSLLFSHTYGMSQDALNKSIQNSEDIVRLTQCYSDILSQIEDIKNIQKDHLKVSQQNNVEIQRLIEIIKKKSNL